MKIKALMNYYVTGSNGKQELKTKEVTIISFVGNNAAVCVVPNTNGDYSGWCDVKQLPLYDLKVDGNEAISK